MGKKFLYFRLMGMNPAFSKESSSKFFKNIDVHPVENVLQLNHHNELRFILSKSLSLQKTLTFDLPDVGSHGVLWQGREWPDLDMFLRKYFILHSAFLFFREEERLPTVLKGPFSKYARRWTILNWQVFQLPAFAYLHNLMLRIRASSDNEVTIDKKFKSLQKKFSTVEGIAITDRELKMAAQRDKQMPRSRKNHGLLTEVDETNGGALSILERLNDREKGRVALLFPKDFSWFYRAHLKGSEIILSDASMTDEMKARVLSCREHFNFRDYTNLISGFLSALNRLLLTTAEAQTDLFFSALEKQFLDFSSYEKQRLEAGLQEDLPAQLLKTILAVNFLLRVEPFDRDEDQKAFLLYAYVEALQEIFNKKKKSKPLLELLQEKLRAVYLDFYTLNHIRDCSATERPEVQFVTDPLKAVQVKTDLIVVDLRAPSNEPYLKYDQQIRQIVNHPLLMEQKSGRNLDFVPPQIAVRMEEITEEGVCFSRMTKPAQSLLTRLVSENKWTRAEQMLREWMNIFYFFELYTGAQNNWGHVVMLLDAQPAIAVYGEEDHDVKLKLQQFFQDSFPKGWQLEEIVNGKKQVKRAADYYALIFSARGME